MAINKKYILSIISVCLILSSFILGYTIAQNSNTFYITSGIYPHATTYTIWREGNYYYGKNAYGDLTHSGTNLTLMLLQIEDIVDNNGGTIFLKDAMFNNVIELSPTVTLIEDLYGKITQYPQQVLFQKQLLQDNDDISLQPWVSPKAIYHANTYRKTYFVFMDTTTTPETYKVRAFNHDTETYGSTYTIGEMQGSYDAHKTPAIGILPNHKLIVFYGAHSSDPLYYRISVNAEDETSWESETYFAISTLGWTYPQPQGFSDKLVLFARDSVNVNNVRWMRTETTDGLTWTGWTEIINFGNPYGTYWIFNKIGNNILASGFIYSYGAIYGGAGNDTYLHLYSMYSDTKGLTWKWVNGTTLTLPINQITEARIQYHLSNDTDAYSGFNIILDDFGKPTITGVERDAVGYHNHYFIMQYSAPLGQLGVWTQTWLQKDNGQTADFDFYSQFFGVLIKDKITFISTYKTENKTMIFQLKDDNIKTRIIYKDSTVLSGADMLYSNPIRNFELAVNPLIFMTAEMHDLYGRTLYGRNYP